jgi:NADH-quinone oxidoreductase subunit L
MQLIEILIINIVGLPLLGALLAYCGGKILGDRFSQIISSAFMVMSAIFAVLVFYDVIFLKTIHHIKILQWLNLGHIQVNWSLYVDAVTAVMLVVVTTVSSIVHIYSIGYMAEDSSVPRFMSYLSLFTFFMLMLVTADNIFQLFFGWEGVGLCSYLLIGFWYHKPSANAAAMKAFIVNRVGDLAFMLGIACMFLTFDDVNFLNIFSKLNQFKANNNIDLICLLLFIGAMGKSAQLGLHTWLPDAMEGPTPVSALIHAATMVTAGVFLVIRFSPLFELSPNVLTLIIYIGAFTALFAATIALVQNDIKKIIAYSTCSQLGYMFFACGVGAYQVALFHLMTHAFFKALLFLCAGNVIYSMHHEQDITKMGGLWRKIPFTYVLMLIGSFALAGVYPFAGYFSKDLILEAAYAHASEAGMLAFSLGICAAFCTAFYSWRLICLVFHGQCQYEDAHEAPKVMILPLIILAIGSIFSGLIAVEMGFLEHNFWSGSLVVTDIVNKAHHLPYFVKFIPLLAGASGIIIACLFYLRFVEIPQVLSYTFYGLYIMLKDRYYIDEIYNYLLVKPFRFLADVMWKIVDVFIIDGLGPNGFAKISYRISLFIGRVQSGYIYNYIFVMILSLVLMLTWYIYSQY